MRGQLPPVADEVMDVFDAVASETDVMLLGSQRAHWTTESLTLKDAEAAEYRAQVGRLVAEALQRFLEATGNH